jgi:hypothetical protein
VTLSIDKFSTADAQNPATPGVLAKLTTEIKQASDRRDALGTLYDTQKKNLESYKRVAKVNGDVILQLFDSPITTEITIPETVYTSEGADQIPEIIKTHLQILIGLHALYKDTHGIAGSLPLALQAVEQVATNSPVILAAITEIRRQIAAPAAAFCRQSVTNTSSAVLGDDWWTGPFHVKLRIQKTGSDAWVCDKVFSGPDHVSND